MGTIVDIDAHYTGHFDDLVEYIDDGPMRTRFLDRPAAPVKGIWPSITSADEKFRGANPRFVDSSDKPWGESSNDIEFVMDKIGVDKIILLGNMMITFDQLRGDDERPTVYANAYVDFMLDQVVDPDEGIYTAIPVPYNAPSEAAELIHRVGDEEGIVGVCFVTGLIEPPLGNRRYDAIFDAASATNLPIILHGGTPGVDNFFISGYSKKIEVHTLSFPFVNASQLVSIVAQGIPERYPSLDFVFQEAGLFWIPMMMYRMDQEYYQKTSQVPILEKLPSEYMKEFYYGTQPLERPPKFSYFEPIVELIGGPERLMYASDYHHTDWDHPRVINQKLPFLSDDERDAVLGGNAERVFDI